ncbi:hypothetical protein GOBAR_DD25646 [Gossypium barbadense]|nr:hypothetical protein GOBAR_DD25646 [Gossypium barbadense]
MDANDDEGPDNDDHSNCQYEHFSDPNLDEVSDDIDDNNAGNDDNVYAPLLSNSTGGILIRNDPSTYMLNIDPNVVHASEFPRIPRYNTFPQVGTKSRIRRVRYRSIIPK